MDGDAEWAPAADEIADAVLEALEDRRAGTVGGGGDAVTWGDIGGPLRSPALVQARRLLVYMLRRRTRMSFPEIAWFVRGTRDKHGTVHGMYVDAMRLARTDAAFIALVANVEARLGRVTTGERGGA